MKVSATGIRPLRVLPGALLFANIATAALIPGTLTSQSLAYRVAHSTGYPVEYADTTLRNGLRVLVVEQRFAPVVAAALVVGVGQRDDPPGQLGLAHFVEHSTGNWELNDYRQRGGWDFPAYTDYDVTVYHLTAPTASLDAALYDLSDVLRRQPLDPGNIEDARRGVIAEFAGIPLQPHLTAGFCQVQLYQFGADRCRSTAEMIAVYRAIPASDVVALWRTRYVPNNSLVVIVGDVTAKVAVQRVDSLFGDLRAGPLPSRPPPAPSEPAPPRRVVIEDSLASSIRLSLSYRTVPLGAPEFPALLVLGELLGGGNRPRLPERLVGEGRPLLRLEVNGVGFFGSTGEAPAAFPIVAEFPESLGVAAAEAAITDELRRVSAGEIDDAEVSRAKSRLARRFVLESRGSGVWGILYHLLNFAAVGQQELIVDWVSLLDAVTKSQVAEAAAKYLMTAPRVTLVSVPPARQGGSR